MEEKTSTKKESSSSDHNNKHGVLWDCGSSLYDSFELKAFEKQLDSAISSRTLSMPHLSDDRRRQLPPPKKQASKISRSLNRLIRSVFRIKNNNNIATADAFYVDVYDRSAVLTTIPEAPEFGGLSPEVRSLVRRTASDRFRAPTSIGISCA